MLMMTHYLRTMSTIPQILPASPQDLSEILALQKRCYQEEALLYDDFTIPPLTQTLASIQEDFERMRFLKIAVEGKVIGAVRAFLEAGTAKVGRLIVDQEYRNQGLGKKLMAAIEAACPEADRFELFTGHKSERNLALYGKLGYQEFRRETVNANLDLVFLEKPGPSNKAVSA